MVNIVHGIYVFFGRVSIIVTLLSVLFVVVVSFLFRLFGLDRTHPIDLFYHRKLSYATSRIRFLRNYVQFYFFAVSLGDLLLIILFLINLTVWYFCPFYMSRFESHEAGFGRISLLCFFLLVFPALRLSIISFTMGIPFERSINSHKLLGFLGILFVGIHFFIHLLRFTFSRSSILMPLLGQIFGLLSGLFLLPLITCSSSFFRRRVYACFLYVHIISTLFVFVCLVFHIPHTSGVVLVPFMILLLDLFWSRWCISFLSCTRFCLSCSRKARAAEFPIVRNTEYHEKTKTARVTLQIRKKSLMNRYGVFGRSVFEPGQIIYLSYDWKSNNNNKDENCVRRFWSFLKDSMTSHPFTITSVDYSSKSSEGIILLTLYIKKRGSFTSRICDHRHQDSISIGLQIDGVYGKGVGDFIFGYDQLVLFAENGHAGLSFGILRKIIDLCKMNDNNKLETPKIKLIWKIDRISESTVNQTLEVFDLFEEDIEFVLKNSHLMDFDFKIWIIPKEEYEKKKKKKKKDQKMIDVPLLGNEEKEKEESGERVVVEEEERSYEVDEEVKEKFLNEYNIDVKIFEKNERCREVVYIALLDEISKFGDYGKMFIEVETARKNEFSRDVLSVLSSLRCKKIIHHLESPFQF